MTDRPPLPPLPHKGGCLCGAVRFSLTAQPKAVNACHCLDCKRLSGNDAAVFIHHLAKDLVIESGGADMAGYRKTADSGREIEIVRCASCGTRLWHIPLAAPTVRFIAAGTLDDSSWVIATSHIWMRGAAGSMKVADDASTFDLSVSGRQELWDHFAAIYGL